MNFKEWNEKFLCFKEGTKRYNIANVTFDAGRMLIESSLAEKEQELENCQVALEISKTITAGLETHLTEMREKVRRLIDKHRTDVKITCEETCWCWEADAAISLMSPNTDFFNLCPGCGRRKARRAEDIAKGFCPKWWLYNVDAVANCKRAAVKLKSDLCPDCGRRKAKDAVESSMGFCPKWWAIHDIDAAEDCRCTAVEKG